MKSRGAIERVMDMATAMAMDDRPRRMMKVIDFHSHILPAIDDGSRGVEMTAQMLQSAASQGIDVMAATPHFYADSMTVENFLSRRTKAFAQIQETAEAENIQIVCGAETAYFSGMSQADKLDMLKIGDTDLLLLEMPFRAWNSKDLREIELLLRRGFRLIIAHLERFYRFQTDNSLIPALFDFPVYIQINAESLLNWKTRRLGFKLFQNGQAHLLGSDCHNTGSKPENLEKGRTAIEKKLGKQYLEKIDQLGTALLEGV